MKSFEEQHWENVYNSRDTTKLGWYEDRPEQSLILIEKCNLDQDDLIIDIGSGASTLIDHLLIAGYNNIVASDISSTALQNSKTRLGKQAGKIKWIVDDITRSEHICKLKHVSLWHDRAVLHFLTQVEQQKAYFNTLNAVVKVNGHIIISAFSKTGATKCSGLDIVNYDEKMIAQHLGKQYQLLDTFDYIYTNPDGGLRPYIYTHFLKTK